MNLQFMLQTLNGGPEGSKYIYQHSVSVVCIPSTQSELFFRVQLCDNTTFIFLLRSCLIDIHFVCRFCSDSLIHIWVFISSLTLCENLLCPYLHPHARAVLVLLLYRYIVYLRCLRKPCESGHAAHAIPL